jgi:hypothetical protein
MQTCKRYNRRGRGDRSAPLLSARNSGRRRSASPDVV